MVGGSGPLPLTPPQGGRGRGEPPPPPFPLPLIARDTLAPFWHDLAKLKPVRREAFSKASLRAGFGLTPVRREAV